MLVVPLVTGGLGGAWAKDDDEDSFYRYLSVFTEVLKLVRTVYVEETDIRSLMAGALDGAADALDPFSVYVPEEEVDDYSAASRVGRARSGVLLLKERGVAFVVAVDEGSPAEALGLRRGDIVSKIDGKSTRDMPLWTIQKTLAQPLGTSVIFEVVRQGEPVDLELQLTDFTSPAPELTDVDEFAVLRLPSFGEQAASQVSSVLATLGDRPLVIDLRGVAAKSVEDGYEVARLFASGELGELKGRGGTISRFESSDVSAFGGELAVLVDRGSLGASEVLVAVLSQSRDAVIVGERTFGWAGRSGRVKLSSGALLELTDAFYTGPDGEPIDEGIEPDLRVVRRPFTSDQDDGEDDGLERALELLREHRGESAEKAAA